MFFFLNCQKYTIVALPIVQPAVLTMAKCTNINMLLCLPKCHERLGQLISADEVKVKSAKAGLAILIFDQLIKYQLHYFVFTLVLFQLDIFLTSALFPKSFFVPHIFFFIFNYIQH